jgi:hypothetical protein
MRRERRPDVWGLRMAKLPLYIEPFSAVFYFKFVFKNTIGS